MRPWLWLGVGVFVGCGGDGVEVRAAELSECSGGGVVVDGFLVCEGQGPPGPMGLPGPVGPAGPMGPRGAVGADGAPGAGADGLGTIVAAAFCSRLEGENLFSYQANVYVFSGGYSFVDLAFSTPLQSANSSRFYPPGGTIQASFVDGIDSGGVARLPGVFTQTVDLVGLRWQMRQDGALYFDASLTDPAFCAATF